MLVLVLDPTHSPGIYIGLRRRQEPLPHINARGMRWNPHYSPGKYKGRAMRAPSICPVNRVVHHTILPGNKGEARAFVAGHNSVEHTNTRPGSNMAAGHIVARADISGLDHILA